MKTQNLQQKNGMLLTESKGSYSHKNPIKFLTNSLESSLCHYSDAYTLVTGNITVTRTIAAAAGEDPPRKKPLNAASQGVFKNCPPFKNCRTEFNDTFSDYADFVNITMPMYNLNEYSDNYSDTSGSLCDFKREEIDNDANLTNDNNAPSFKFEANLIDNIETNGKKKSKNSCTTKIFK